MLTLRYQENKNKNDMENLNLPSNARNLSDNTAGKKVGNSTVPGSHSQLRNTVVEGVIQDLNNLNPSLPATFEILSRPLERGRK
jgi:hypothetical protein